MDSLLSPGVSSALFSSRVTSRTHTRTLVSHPSTCCALFWGFCSSRASPVIEAATVSRMSALSCGGRVKKGCVTCYKGVSSRMLAPARDRIIDFGTYRGRMLGTLPSRYLKWMSKNLYAGDFEEWAKLAAAVLDDPIYRDRIEWEYVERILAGNSRLYALKVSPVSQYRDISERFGWDNEDQVGWSRVKFELLGTSMGGRIPRKKGEAGHDGPFQSHSTKDQGPLKASSYVSRGSEKFESKRVSSLKENKVGVSEQEKRITRKDVEGSEATSRERRQQRRVRQNLRRQQFNVSDRDIGVVDDGEGSIMDLRLTKQHDRSNVNRTFNPFPGRDEMLKKIYRRK